ncbi:MAG: ComEC/Rec2 family competence protein, partial [Gemmataceae bacterium]|nr:ComEC/Rec2 family competence protein [Gemmataceae bacterium]MDW8266955.1 ComEC/Rec2 family competence protein [Gemmataceae bacterium]
LLGVAALGAAHHHAYRDVAARDDIRQLADEEPRPVQLRGVILQEPTLRTPAETDRALRSVPEPETSRSILAVTHIHLRDDWQPASGRARLLVSGRLSDIHVRDEVEVVGWLRQPRGPSNPGEFDYAAFLRDQGIGAEVWVRRTPHGVTRLARAGVLSLSALLASVRAWGERTLVERLPDNQWGMASALLLGESTDLSAEAWERYQRTGVVYVLVISGQHLTVMAGMLWAGVRLIGCRLRRAAGVVALLVVLYALLTGARPPIVRAAVLVVVVCGGLILRRPAPPANAFALAGLVVLAMRPTDLFQPGTQLSFLAAGVLAWLGIFWRQRRADPLERLTDEAQPMGWRLVKAAGRAIGRAYVAALIVWLAVTPLVAAHYHLVSPVSMVIGPPTVLLTSASLALGFVLLVTAAVCPAVAPLFAALTSATLTLADWLVGLADRCPGGHWYVTGVAVWWLCGFYLGLAVALAGGATCGRPWWPSVATIGATWLAIGVGASSFRPSGDELRCTFLAVGHGGAVVLETPDRRTLVYDAGALAGPEVAQRQIAPFLWSRGLKRIDELFISHGDLDHFNGVPGLAERFAIGLVTCTPTFADRRTPGVAETLAVLRTRGIPVRVVSAGARLRAGPVEIEVLHPPAQGPEGSENARSLVLEVRHQGHTLLLTGDLEGPGLARVLTLPARRIDVLMAPHHGSPTANGPALAAWAAPKVVVSCEGFRPGRPRTAAVYQAVGAAFYSTWEWGAVTLRSHASGLVLETFRHPEQRRVVVRGGAGPAAPGPVAPPAE